MREAYLKREYRRFLRAIGFKDSSREDREKLMALLEGMRETGRKRGMSEYELATIYDAKTLLALYRETVAMGH